MRVVLKMVCALIGIDAAVVDDIHLYRQQLQDEYDMPELKLQLKVSPLRPSLVTQRTAA